MLRSIQGNATGLRLHIRPDVDITINSTQQDIAVRIDRMVDHKCPCVCQDHDLATSAQRADAAFHYGQAIGFGDVHTTGGAVADRELGHLRLDRLAVATHAGACGDRELAIGHIVGVDVQVAFRTSTADGAASGQGDARA